VGLTASGARVFGSTSYKLQIVSSYAITALIAVVAALAILTITLGLIRHKKEVRSDLFWISWIIAAGSLGISIVYGPEALNRAFMFALLPTSYFALSLFKRKPAILVMVLLTLVLLNIPAQYGNYNYTYMPSTELKGATFFTNHASGNESFFYELLAPTGKSNWTGTQLNMPSTYFTPSFQFINQTVDSAKFIISSNQERNYYEYFFGYNLLENLNLESYNSRIYDNEGFQMYLHT
jgi:hypothetical protein